MDIVFINPSNRKDNYGVLGRELAAFEPPFWAAMLAGSLQEKHGLSVHIIDANLEGLSAEETAQRALALEPYLIVVVVYGQNPSASTQLMPGVIDLVKAINSIYESKFLKTILVGGHIAALPEQSLNETGADYVCLGEGLDAIESVFFNVCLDYDGILTDVGYKLDDVYTEAYPAKLNLNLDKQYPKVAWHLLNMSHYRAHIDSTLGFSNLNEFASLYTSLGCPYNCNFCCIHAPFKSGEKAIDMKHNSYRMWSVDWVMEQFDTLVNVYGIQHIKIIDELFLCDMKRTEEICDKLIERGYNLNIKAYARLNQLNTKILSKLKKAGFNWLSPGIESANIGVRNTADKALKQSDIFDGVNMIRDQGIYISANYIFGLPNDNLDTMQETLDLAIQLNTEWANFNCCTAFPGSELYNDCIENNVELPSDWSGYSYYSKDAYPLNTQYLTGKEVRDFRDKAFIQYYDRIEYREMLYAKLGQVALDTVDKILSYKVIR